MARLAALVLGSCATGLVIDLVSLVLSSCHLSRQQELLQVTCGDVRRDGCECMKDLGRALLSIHKSGGVGRADRY